ncbi:MAG TPA: autotransporter outer membrane beta-barrel domain-containing protein [Rhabdochlamydiaceae bacterium]|nr:autotransporter outer membrane beta-barrel domain-containing protein [Rhabdochlamydiaceae bacterium]
MKTLILSSLISSVLYADNGIKTNALTTYASQNGYLSSSQALTDHLRQKRFHPEQSTEKSIALLADQFLADASETRFNQKPSRKAEATQEEPQKEQQCGRDPFNIWITPYGEYAKTPTFNLGVGAALGGIEYTTEKKNVVGFGLAYVYTHVHKNVGHGKVNQGFLTLYGTLNSSNWYVDLGIWGGYYNTFNQRKVSGKTAKSSTYGWQTAPHFEIGYDGYWGCEDDLNWFGIEPFLSGDWVANWEHGLREHGAGSFDIRQKGRFCSEIRAETGLRLYQIATCSWGQVVFREKTSYAYQKTFRTGSIQATLLGSPGSFTVNTLTGAQNLGVIELSMLFIHYDPEKPYVDLRYQGEFGAKYQSHQLMLELGTNF